MSRLNHPNVLRFFGLVVDGPMVVGIMTGEEATPVLLLCASGLRGAAALLLLALRMAAWCMRARPPLPARSCAAISACLCALSCHLPPGTACLTLSAC